MSLSIVNSKACFYTCLLPEAGSAFNTHRKIGQFRPSICPTSDGLVLPIHK